VKNLVKPVLVLTFLALTIFLMLDLAPIPVRASDASALSGKIVDIQGQPVQGAHVALFVDKDLEPYVEQETDHAGQFVLDLPDGAVDSARLPGILRKAGGVFLVTLLLSMGSALGANTSLIGATNNMVTAGIAQRAGFPITFRTFIKPGLPAALVTLIVGTLWILIRY